MTREDQVARTAETKPPIAGHLGSVDIGLNPKRENTVIVLQGPPRSGKSCLREALKEAIQKDPEAKRIGLYPYVITACPDGEGAWFQKAAEHDPEQARRLKDDYKKKFTPQFVERVASSVEQVSLPLAFVDIGGIVSAENRKICASATHAILISPTKEQMEEWREFNRELAIKSIAEVISDYNGKTDTVSGVEADGILRGSVHYLERGEPAAEREMVKALAHHVIALIKSRVSEEQEKGNA